MTATDDRPTHEHLASLQAPRSAAGRWALVSAVVFLYCWYAALELYEFAVGRSFGPLVIDPTTFPGGLEIGALLAAAFFVVAVPHELLHGVTMRWYGGRPRYGVRTARFGIPYAYAETHAAYSRNQMLVILLAPLVSISLVGFALALWLGSRWPLLLLAANAAGSIGDGWMACRLLEYPASVRVGPPPTYGDGALSVYGHPSSAPESLSRIPRSFLVGAVGTVVALVSAVVVLVFVSLVFDSGAVVLDIGGGRRLFRHERTGGVVALEIGHRSVGALAVAGGFLWVGIETVLAATRRNARSR